MNVPPSPTPAAVLRRLVSDDIEDYTQRLQDWQLEYDQLDRGRFHAELLDLRLDGLQLFAETTRRSLRQRGTLSPGSIGVAVMAGGDGELLVNGVRPGRDGLVAVHDGELELTSPAGCRLLGVVAGAQRVQAAALALLGRPLALSPGLASGVTAEPGRVTRFGAALRRATEAAQHGPEALADAGDALLVPLVELLDDARPADREGRAAQRRRLVERACALLLAHGDEAPGLDEICDEVGSCARKLNYCFQDVVGMSPTRYARTLRLNAARRELCRSRVAGLSVYDVASHWGFWHFGRFSCAYRQQFGESPSHSLRRARSAMFAENG